MVCVYMRFKVSLVNGWSKIALVLCGKFWAIWQLEMCF